MFEYIDKLRKSPDSVKHRFVITVSVCVTGIIALIWIVMLVIRINAGGLFSSNEGVISDTTTNIFKDSWNKLSEQINQFASSTSLFFQGTDEFIQQENIETTENEVIENETTATSSDIIE